MVLNTVLSPPIPAYQNFPIQPQNYQPSRFVITAISRGITTTITTSVNHNYVVGQQVRTLIPPTFGTRQLNEQTSYVISIPSSNQVQLNINSNGMDPFILSSATVVAQIVSVGDVNQGQINANGLMNQGLSPYGSFINISN
jgi:hypothetical protein